MEPAFGRPGRTGGSPACWAADAVRCFLRDRESHHCEPSDDDGSGRFDHPVGPGDAGCGRPAGRCQGAWQAHGRSERHHPAVQLQEARRDHRVGYDLDMVHAVAKRLGAGGRDRSVSSAERIPMLKDGKLDFVATSMTRTPERLKDIDFSFIYFVTPHAVIVQEIERHHLGAPACGKKSFLGQHVDRRPQSQGGRARRRAGLCARLCAGLRLLKEDKVDAFPTDETVLRAIVQQDGRPDEYVFLSDFTKSRNVGFALKKDEPRFKDAINKALLDVETSGEAVKIFDAWFGPQSQEPMARKFKIQAD